MSEIANGIDAGVAAAAEHDQFVANLRTLGLDADAWVRWVNERAKEGPTHQQMRASAIANILSGRLHPDEPPPQISAGYAYADEPVDDDAREIWAWAWGVTRSHFYAIEFVPSGYSDEDTEALQMAMDCRDAREQPDPLTLPLRRGHPRTRGHDRG